MSPYGLAPHTEEGRARFVHVSFYWSRGTPKTTELEDPVFSVAIDWIRYNSNCWILYTTTGPEWWYERIRHYMNTSDRVFICEISVSETAGWQEQWIWDWLSKPR